MTGWLIRIQIWNTWVWNICEHLIGNINGGIHSECKQSNPYCCNSLVGVQSGPVGLCVVHRECTNTDCRLPSSPMLLVKGPPDELHVSAALYMPRC